MQAAAIGAFAFAIGLVALSAWHSFQPQDQQANDNTNAKEPAKEGGQSPPMVLPKEAGDEAIVRYNRWIMIFTGALALVAFIQIAFLIDANRVAQ